MKRRTTSPSASDLRWLRARVTGHRSKDFGVKSRLLAWIDRQMEHAELRAMKAALDADQPDVPRATRDRAAREMLADQRARTKRRRA